MFMTPSLVSFPSLTQRTISKAYVYTMGVGQGLIGYDIDVSRYAVGLLPPREKYKRQDSEYHCRAIPGTTDC